MRALIGAATTSGQGSSADGITIAEVSNGRLTPIGVGATVVENPMYVTTSADGTVLYTVHEAADGMVSAWTIGETGLTALGSPRSTGGSGPCHLSLHPSGRYLLVANYGSGSLSVHPVGADGSLGAHSDVVQHRGSGPNTARQSGPHAHMVVTDPGSGPGRGHILATDLGTDTVYRYALDEASGRLHEVDQIRVEPGAGPRHLVIHEHFAYVVNELDSTVAVVDLTAPAVVGTMSTVGGDSEAGFPSAVRLGADARFLYVANRGPDEIAVLSVDGPELTLVSAVPCGGTHPRDIQFDPTGRRLLVANQFSDEITLFGVDPDTGMLKPTGTALTTPSPACIVFLP